MYDNQANSGPPAFSTAPLIKEFHTCMGLNACKGHDRLGTNECAGQGVCATVNHSCHTLNNCRNQGGCGLYGGVDAQKNPGINDCAWQGSCASPINAERFITAGEVEEEADSNGGKKSYNRQSVWQRARLVFEQRMQEIGREVGPPPPEAHQTDKEGKSVAVGPSHSYITDSKAFPGYASCGASGMSGGGSCG